MNTERANFLDVILFLFYIILSLTVPVLYLKVGKCVLGKCVTSGHYGQCRSRIHKSNYNFSVDKWSLPRSCSIYALKKTKKSLAAINYYSQKSPSLSDLIFKDYIQTFRAMTISKIHRNRYTISTSRAKTFSGPHGLNA